MAFIRRLTCFGLVGLAGFLVDAGLLLVLHHGFGIAALAARLISIAVAVLVTWRLNRSVTFGSSASRQLTEGIRYGAVALTVAAFNYGFYCGALAAVPTMPPLLAAALATIAAMGVSFLGYSWLVFGHGRAAQYAHGGASSYHPPSNSEPAAQPPRSSPARPGATPASDLCGTVRKA